MRSRLVVLATGGTIAGRGRANGERYDAGVLSVDEVLSDAPDLQQVAEIEARTLCDPSAVGPANPEGRVMGPSYRLSETIWLGLAREVRRIVDRSDVAGVVILHGTDTLEETACLLQLTVATRTPIALVGAARPSRGHPDPDGPRNLRSAVRLALDAGARGRGVFVVSNRSAFPALDVTKAIVPPPDIATDSAMLEPFIAPIYGPVARCSADDDPAGPGLVEWIRGPRAALLDRLCEIKFGIEDLVALPTVPILSQHVGSDAHEVLERYYIATRPDVRAFVLAGFSNGALTVPLLEAVRRLQPRDDVAFVRSSRVLSKWVRHASDLFPDTVGASTLSPQHARILVSLLQAAVLRGDRLGAAVDQCVSFRAKVHAFFAERVPYLA